MKLASFDIFDTTLIRKCGEPENVFYLLSKRLYPDDEALQNAFFLWRKEAELAAVENLKNHFVTIEEIYTEFDALSFPGLNVQDIILQEKAIERESLVANAEIRRLISQKRQEGYVICFISDMYLDSTFLKEILLSQRCALPEDKVFVSCELKATKGERGKLYETVRPLLGEKIERWEHYGDNLRSDYKNAAKHGIKSTWVHTEYTGAEQKLLDMAKYYPYCLELSILIGLQRAARFASETRNADVDNAADFVASMFIPYVLYVLNKSRELGLKRLYFLSRDGYIIQRIAEQYQDLFPDIEFRYLLVSRDSLFLPSLYTLDKEELCDNKNTKSLHRIRIKVAELLFYLKTSEEELGAEFSDRITFRKIKTEEQENLFLQALQLPGVKGKILGKAGDARKVLIDYFKQEGLFDNLPYGTVDIGWGGTTRAMINRILTREGMPEMVSFYCGCTSVSLPPKCGQYYSYYSYRFFVLDSVRLLEQYYSASPYASTDSYYYEGDEVKAKYKTRKYSQDLSLVEANIETACQVARFIQSYDYLDFSKVMCYWGSTYLQMFMEMSCKVDYSTFRRLGIFEDRNVQYKILKIVNPFRLLEYLYKGKMKRTILPRQSIYYTYRIKACRPENSLRNRRRRFCKKLLLPLKIKLSLLKSYFYK